MKPSEFRTKVLEELNLIPEDRLREVYDFIYFFRLGLETSRSARAGQIMKFAGCWDDMPDDDFKEFLGDIARRRSNAFLNRDNR